MSPVKGINQSKEDMKIFRVLSASVLAGAVLLSVSGCSSAEGKGETPVAPVATLTADPSSTASPSETESAVSETTDIDGILLTINGYYYYISQPDSSDSLKNAEASIGGSSNEEIKQFAEDFSEGFKYFDTSTVDKIQNAYKALMIGTSAGKLNEGLKMTIPSDSVTITGDTATVNTTHLKVTLNGEKKRVTPEENPDEKDLVHLVKNDSGSWVIVAKTSSVDPSSP